MKKAGVISIIFVTIAIVGIYLFLCLSYILYPIKYKDTILLYSSKYNIKSNLIASLINAESSFNSDAVSKKGAIGLMQIMPSTAQWLAGKLEIEYSEDLLFDPDYNIKIGTFYLAYLSTKFSDTKTMLCAYNAGEGVVLKWLEDEEYSKDVFSYRFEDQKENINSAFGTSDFSNKVFQMEHSAPKEFLMRILRTSYIPDDYLTLINELSSKGNLSHALINCILDYTFEKCQGKLPSEYVKKVASSLKYQNIRTASDAMAFLYQQDLNYAKKKRRKKDYVQDSKGDSNVVSVSETSQKEDENETNDYWSVLGGRM